MSSTHPQDDRINDIEQRQAVLEERISYRGAERAQDFLTLSKLFDQTVDLRVSQRVLETRVAIYAGLGSFLGAAVMSIVVNVLLEVIRH